MTYTFGLMSHMGDPWYIATGTRVKEAEIAKAI